MLKKHTTVMILIIAKPFKEAQGLLIKLDKSDIRLGYANMMLGSCRYQLHDYESAIPYFQTAAKIYNQHCDKTAVKNLSLWGHCLSYLKLSKEAAKVFVDAIETYKTIKHDDLQLLADLFINAGIAFWFSNEPVQSKEFFKKAVDTASSEALSLSTFSILANMLTGIVLIDPSNEAHIAEWSDLANRAREFLRTKKAEVKSPTTKRLIKVTIISETWFQIHTDGLKKRHLMKLLNG